MQIFIVWIDIITFILNLPILFGGINIFQYKKIKYKK